MRRALLFFAAACAVACGPKTEPETSATLAETCKKTPAPEASTPPPSGPPAVPPSRMVTHVEMKLEPLARDLETRIPKRVADERGKDIGVAGSLNYTVDRGPFSLAVEGENLLVRTELHGHAEACAKGRCYASCDPVGTAMAAVPLRLTPDWRFQPSHVTVVFTRGCQVRALGGFVTVDVTPTLQAQMGPALHGVEQAIDARLPKPRPEAERMWKELLTPKALPLGACIVVAPRAIVQGPISGTPASLRARFGLVAYPEMRTRCGDQRPPSPLPPLAHDPQMPAEDDLVVALVTPLTNVASALSAAAPFALDGDRVRVASATVAAAGPDLDLALDLRGEACGPLAIRTPAAWTDDATQIRFTAPRLGSGPRIAPAMAPDTIRETIPTLASSLSDPTVDVRANVREVKPLAAYARGDEMVEALKMRGSVEIVQK